MSILTNKVYDIFMFNASGICFLENQQEILFHELSKYNEYKIKIKNIAHIFLTHQQKNREKTKKLKINEDAIEVLIEHIGTNLRQFDGELEKLKLSAYPENLVTKKMVEENCISNQDLFNITNYLMQGEKGKALLEFKRLLDVKYPLEILSALQTMLRQWVIIKAKSSCSISEIMKLSGIKNEYRVQNLKKNLKNVSLRDLVHLKESLYDVECRIKSGQVLDINSEVEIALIR